ncbi:MAG: iron-containing alcohol dehydrogenase [[Clostridium] fimetarium]|nr:iron-containing alcohol dehydrogenase [Alistipes timonensis]MCM1405141.1 iron-containing alcohol dehydrogenase [[Clostridium] fimetarium]
MENFSYQSPTRYVFGRGAEERSGELTASLGCRKVLIVCGGGSARRSGLLDRVERSLDAAGVSHTELSGIRPNPTDDRVYEGIALCRAEGVDGILAVGGGSVIDTAKAIAAGVPYEGDFWDFWAGKAVVGEALPVGVVLTIPAAGSEGSGNSVITKLDGMHKISLRTDSALRPKFAVMNPELTFTLPPEQTAAGIADMMAHIMERYFSPTEGVEITDRVSEGVLRAIVEEAPKVMARPDDYDARANIMWSGTLAHNGICGCGRREDWASHGLEHVLSALHGVTHGAGLAVVFPAWMTYAARTRPAKIAQFGRRVFGVTATDDSAAATEAITALRAFYRSIGLPLTLGDLGIANPDFAEMTAMFHRDKGNPFGAYISLAPADTEAIYRLML